MPSDRRGSPIPPCPKGHGERYLSSDGRYRCRTCIQIRNASKWKANKSKLQKQNRDNYLKSREDRLAYAKKYRDDNFEAINKKQQVYRSENKELIREGKKRYYEKNKDLISERKRAKYKTNPTYPLLSVYQGMIQRCYNPNNKNYKHYGRRGIVVCDRWVGYDGYSNFLEDMESTYIPGLTLDRIRTNEGYSPGNCRWATITEQNNNKRNNLQYRKSISENEIVVLDGKAMTLKQMSQETGIFLPVLKYRFAMYPDSEYILKWDYDNRYYEYQGHRYNLTELSLLSGLSFSIISDRLRKLNWSVEASVETPPIGSKS